MALTTPVLLDVESRSRADLAAVGGRRYWEHPSSEILVVVWYDTATGDVGVWAPGMPWPFVGRVLAAHNAHGFDRFALARYGIDAPAWIDTAQLARRAGLPGALDALGTRWAGVAKDKDASRFTKALSAVRRPLGVRVARDVLAHACPKCGAAAHEPCVDGKSRARDPHAPRVRASVVTVGGIDAATWAALSPDERREHGTQPTIDAATMARVTAYCASDVAIMAATWPRLAQWLDVDADVGALDTRVNDRGVAFDAALARRLLAEDARNADAAIATAARALGWDAAAVRAAAMSPAQFCAATGAADAQAATIATLEHPLADARKALASIARGKLLAGLARVHADGRMRDTLVYYGAHTGRWSGRGMQLHNLPRPAAYFEALPEGTPYPHTINAKGERVVDVDRLAEDVLAGRPCDADAIALLVRATLYAPPGRALVAMDFASVEARGTAWMAGDAAALDVFRSGRDPYKVAAAKVFECSYDAVTKAQRQIGKIAELACGFGGGPAAFKKFAHAFRVDVSALDLGAIVGAWRTLHAPIRALWYTCERAFRSACNGRPACAGPLEYVPSDDGTAVACFLPSGRPIVYNDASAGEDSLSYVGSRGREHTYGGKLVENAVQATCRDLLAHAMLAIDARAPVVLHVHDEVVVEVREADADAAARALRDAMLDAPAWAAGFPIDASGWIGRRYRK